MLCGLQSSFTPWKLPDNSFCCGGFLESFVPYLGPTPSNLLDCYYIRDNYSPDIFGIDRGIRQPGKGYTPRLVALHKAGEALRKALVKVSCQLWSQQLVTFPNSPFLSEIGITSGGKGESTDHSAE
jgi:hypothetical protein